MCPIYPTFPKIYTDANVDLLEHFISILQKTEEDDHIREKNRYCTLSLKLKHFNKTNL